jgi:hypothetical protein
MPLKKLVFKSGVNRENTRYTTEGGYYECDKIRFRQGTPEKIGGWQRISNTTFLGVCRSLWNWVTLSSLKLISLGTNLKFYIENGGVYHDITPLRIQSSNAVTLLNPISTVQGSSTVTLTTNAIFTGTISGTTLTVSAVTANYIAVDQVISGTGITVGTKITALGTGTGGAGTYTIDTSQTVSSPTTITGINPTSVAATLQTGDGVTLITSAAVGGVPATQINEYHVLTRVSDGVYTFKVASPATSTVNYGGGTGISANLISNTVKLTNPFDTTSGSANIVVNDADHGAVSGDFVTFFPSTTFNNVTINGTYQLSVLTKDKYQISTAWPFTGFISGTTLTVLSISKSYLAVGQAISGTGVTPGTTISALGSGTGGVGTYTVSTSQTVGNSDNAVNMTTSWLANATSTGVGGTVYAQYEINTGPEYVVPQTGWGAGPWGFGTWGFGQPGTTSLRLWSQSNFGEDLVFAPQEGGIYFWDASYTYDVRGYNISLLPDASDTPTVQNFIFVSDTFRFVFAFGCNDYGSSTQDPMLVRWSDQESVGNWTPSATNQAGSLRLSHGSQIVAAVQTRQEIFVLTDSAAYGMQYLGPPYVWNAQLLGDNISIVGQNAIATASGVVFWMGVDKFYLYNGQVKTLRCDLRQYIYNDINLEQQGQFFAGTNEGFNEVWWFYCSAGSTTIDRYVVYNYLEDVWYYGTMARTAWMDSGINNVPFAATYTKNIVNHETGLDDGETATTLAINSYIETSQFDIDDGHNLGFIWRMLPDITFRGSSTANPLVVMTLIPYLNSGSGPYDPASEGGSDSASVTRTATVPIEQFTGQVYIRVRGRQLSFKVENNQLGATWQLGSPRIDIKNDGRR